jgi:arsenate reductase
MAHYFGRYGVFTYSGGTEATAVFSQTLETLKAHGFAVTKLFDSANPVWALRYDEQAAPIVCFSKAMDHEYNPSKGFGAIMTCDSADEACPFVPGASVRFPIRYVDPKSSDGTDRMVQTYHERSLEIAREMKYIFER